jgi:hypothetical protein
MQSIIRCCKRTILRYGSNPPPCATVRAVHRAGDLTATDLPLPIRPRTELPRARQVVGIALLDDTVTPEALYVVAIGDTDGDAVSFEGNFVSFVETLERL